CGRSHPCVGFSQIFSCSIRFLGLGFRSYGYDFREGVLPMGRNGNGTHYAAVSRADVPQGRKGKHRKAVADILADLPKLNAHQAIKIPLSSLNGEDAESSLCSEPRYAREKHSGGNVERREIPVRLACRPCEGCGSNRLAAYAGVLNRAGLY